MQKILIQILSILFPSWVVQLAYNQLTNPKISKLRPHELTTLDKAEKEILKFQGFDIQLYHWRGGPEKVLLIHGWEGQAGNFSDIIERLQKENYSVFAFDGPSHGFSSKGETSLFEFSALVAVLIKKFGVSKLVSHSFGGVATTYGLYTHPEIEIAKYLLLTTPDKFSERINDIAEMVGISHKVKSKLLHRVEKETGIQVNTMNVSDFVKEINVDKALIIHDKNDRVIPISQSRNIVKNWKNSSLEEIEGTGHFRILRTDSVIERVVDFLA